MVETNAAAKSRPDHVAFAMALVTAIVLAIALWGWLGPRPIGPPPKVGTAAPPLALTDAATGQPTIVIAEPGRVVWVAFWSSKPADAGAEAAQLDRIRRRFRGRDPFVLIAATLDDEDAGRLRKALGEPAASLPVFVVAPASREAFGVAEPPLHFLIDGRGQVVAVARGRGDNLERMADQAEDLLDAIAPPGPRFASVRAWPAG